MRLLTALLAACDGPSGDGPQGDGPDTDTVDTAAATGDTGTTPTGPPFSASCELQPYNGLRADCTVTVDPPGPVEVTVAPADGRSAARTFRSDAVASEHTVGLWYLFPDSPHDWTARAVDLPGVEVSGTLTTGGVSSGADVALLASGTSTAPLVGVASPCLEYPTVVIFDTATAEVVWYQPVPSPALGFLDAVSFTEDGTVLTIADGQVSEHDKLGNLILELRPGVELLEQAHHDVFRKDGLTYVLFQEIVGEHVLDGFYVFDGAGAKVGEWHLADHFIPATPDTDGLPDDTSHANAIWVDDDGQALFSMRHLSAIAAVRGDPAAADFGEIVWRMADPASEFGTDFTYASSVAGPADFQQQHNVHLLPDGRMTMFDNREIFDEVSRVVELSFDPATGSAVFEREYPLVVHCDFQGGAWRTPAGNPLATCAPMRRAYELDATTAEVVWEAEVVCRSGASIYVPRFVPLSE